MRHLLLPSLLVLAGCAENGHHYPSLLPREAENRVEPAPAVPMPALPDAALDARIAALAGQSEEASQAFTDTAQEAEARIAVARGLPPGSETWLTAQAALASLDAAREPIFSALADLERLAIDRGMAGLVPYPALDNAIAAARARADSAEQRSSALEAALVG